MKEFPNDCGDKFDAIDLEICSKLTNMSNDDTEKVLKLQWFITWMERQIKYKFLLRHHLCKD